MPEEKPEFIKTNTIKNYVKAAHNFRSADDAVSEVISRFSTLIETVITESVNLAKEDKRTTILLKDTQTALEKVVGKKYLSWEDILKEILRQKPTDLGNISAGIIDYIKEHEKKELGIDIASLSTFVSKNFNLPKTQSEKIVKYISDEILSRKFKYPG
jgi:histone H3/H4